MSTPIPSAEKTGKSPEDERAYQAAILPHVSRTFALTIPQLPDALREVVGNAYLLCRIADNIEDDTALDSASKDYFATAFIQVLEGERDAGEFARALHPLLGANLLPAERDLILNTPRVVRLTRSFSPRRQQALLRCVRVMARGMADFQRRAHLRGLSDLEEMSRYCYYVAGVVGEMLTELFCDYSPEIARRREQLFRLAPAFGQGLQMTNILKDIWEDRQRGACWLPREVFARHDCDLERLQPGGPNPGFSEGLGELIGLARDNLRQALDYVLWIPRKEVGIRRFCLWALGMAVLTLKRINARRDFSAGDQVKISRRSVKATVAVTSLLAGNDTALRLLFGLHERRLPGGVKKNRVISDSLEIGKLP